MPSFATLLPRPSIYVEIGDNVLCNDRPAASAVLKNQADGARVDSKGHDEQFGERAIHDTSNAHRFDQSSNSFVLFVGPAAAINRCGAEGGMGTRYKGNAQETTAMDASGKLLFDAAYRSP